MNEEWKKSVFISCVFFIAVLCLQSVVDGAAIRRANTTIDDLKRELDNAERRVGNVTRELEDSRTTIRGCYNSVGRIADNLAEQSTELSEIIANLRTVREEIKTMENNLDFFYIKYGYNNNNFNNTGGEVE